MGLEARAPATQQALRPVAPPRPVKFGALVLAAGVVAPWLNPAAGGPSAVIFPWLVAAAATLLLWLFVSPEVSRKHFAVAVGGAVLLSVAGRVEPQVLLAVAGMIVIALCAAVASNASRHGWIRDALVAAWVATAAVSSVFALLQYFGLSSHFGSWINPTEAGEAFANLRQRNQFATLTSIGLLALQWHGRRGARLSWLLPLAVLMAAANAASASRTGGLQVAAFVALTLWWVRPLDRRTVALCCVAVGAYAASAVLLPPLLHQVAGVVAPNAFGRLVNSEGCSSRSVLWSNVLHLIAQRPWLGWGWGELDYAHFATLYPGPRFCDILDNAHNLPLHLAVELGLPVAVLACCGFLWWAGRQRPWRETDPTRQLAWGVVAVILLHSLLEYPLWYGPFQMASGFSLGLLARESVAAKARTARPLVRGASMALLLLLLYAGWDYYRVSQLYTPPGERSFLYRDRPLPRIGDSWLFRDQLAFAQLSVTPLTRDNAGGVNTLALEMLHYSPEPRVIDVAIESAMWIGREDLALWLLTRLRAAFPEEAAGRPTAAPPANPSSRQLRP